MLTPDLFPQATLVVTPRFTLEGMLKSIERYRINHLLYVTG